MLFKTEVMKTINSITLNRESNNLTVGLNHINKNYPKKLTISLDNINSWEYYFASLALELQRLNPNYIDATNFHLEVEDSNKNTFKLMTDHLTYNNGFFYYSNLFQVNGQVSKKVEGLGNKNNIVINSYLDFIPQPITKNIRLFIDARIEYKSKSIEFVDLNQKVAVKMEDVAIYSGLIVYLWQIQVGLRMFLPSVRILPASVELYQVENIENKPKH
jgi:hypothetical protein